MTQAHSTALGSLNHVMKNTGQVCFLKAEQMLKKEQIKEFVSIKYIYSVSVNKII